MNSVTTTLSRTLSRRLAETRKIGGISLPLWRLASGLAIFSLALAVLVWRLDQAPDVFSDEIVYTRVGIRVVAEGAAIWDTGNPVFVHPPLYFLVESIYLRLAANPFPPLYTPGDIFASVYLARYLNAFLGALTALLLYMLGRRLRSHGLGLLLAALFILDPFGLRINRRAMLETLAGLLSLSGMAILLTSRPYRNGWRPIPRAIVAGLLLGAGMLTKEMAFTTPLAILTFALWESWRVRSTWRRQFSSLVVPFLAAGIAFLTYGIFPLWALTTGRWDRFITVKSLSLQRLMGLVHTSGWNRPGLSIVDFLIQRLTDYGSTYTLLALGGLATLTLLLLARRERTSRLLGVWGLTLYPFFAFLALFGSGNDQFFYFLLLPAIILSGYTLTKPWAISVRDQSDTSRSLIRWIPAIRPSSAKASALPGVLLILLLAFVLPYNFARWWNAYATGQDNGYYQMSRYVAEHVPPGEPINASGDTLKFRYFFPNHPIAESGTSSEARAAGVNYFVLAPKDIWARYGNTTEELAAWIVTSGERLFATSGDSYGDIFLYRVDYPAEASLPLPVSPTDAGFIHTFPQAETGFVAFFVGALFVWTCLWGGLAGALAVLLTFKRWAEAPSRNVGGSRGTGRTSAGRARR